MKKAEFIIKGTTPCKKNMLEIRTRYKNYKFRRWIAPNDKYQDWEEGAAKELWIQAREDTAFINDLLPIEYPVWLKVVFYRKKKQKIDLTNLLQSIEDALAKANIIKDDSQINSFDGSRVFFGHDDERAEITLYWPLKEHRGD